MARVNGPAAKHRYIYESLVKVTGKNDRGGVQGRNRVYEYVELLKLNSADGPGLFV